jgi:hypothetical protein
LLSSKSTPPRRQHQQKPPVFFGRCFTSQTFARQGAFQVIIRPRGRIIARFHSGTPLIEQERTKRGSGPGASEKDLTSDASRKWHRYPILQEEERGNLDAIPFFILCLKSTLAECTVEAGQTTGQDLAVDGGWVI